MQVETFDEAWEAIGEELDFIGDVIMDYKGERDVLMQVFTEHLQQVDDAEIHAELILEYRNYLEGMDACMRPARDRLRELTDQMKLMKAMRENLQEEHDEWN